jgi:hypothetical protein
MKTLPSVKDSRVFMAMICLICVAIYFSPLAKNIADWAKQDQLIDINDLYLAERERQDRDNILMLAEINAFLAVLQSSEVGISLFVDVQVTIGHSISVLKELTDRAFESTLISMTSIVGLRWILKLADYLAPAFFIIWLMGLSVYLLASWLGLTQGQSGKVGKRALGLSFVLFLMLHIMLPYSVYLSSLISHPVLSAPEQEKNSSLKNFHQHLVKPSHSMSFKDKAEKDIKQFETTLVQLPKKIESMTYYVVEHWVFNLLRHILIPFALLILMHVITKRGLQWIVFRR